MKNTNCPNCGAPITGYKCEYCGTQFYDFTNMELNEAGYIRIKAYDQILTFKAVPIHLEMTHSPYEMPSLDIGFVLLEEVKCHKMGGRHEI